MAAALRRLTIQDAIIAGLNSVTGVENVYDDRKRADDVDAFVLQFAQQDRQNVQFWEIFRVSSPVQTAQIGLPIPIRSAWYWHSFRIELWYGIKRDDSEAKFQALIDDVIEKFAELRTLGGCRTDKPMELVSIRNDARQGVQCRVALFEVRVNDPQDNLTPV